MDKDLCILCDCKKKKLLNAHGILEKNGKVIDFNNFICKKCGLVFIYPQLSKQEYDNIYRKYEKSRHLFQEEKNINAFIEKKDYINKGAGVYDFIKEFLVNGKKILDIGAGFGQISRSLKYNFNCDIKSVEPSNELSKIMKEKLGLDVFCGSFEEFLNFNTEKYNLLILHHVFEHFINPNQVLEQFKNLLLPDGVIYIEVPNVISFKKPVNHFFDYMHLFNYSPRTFKQLVEKNGFKLLKVNKNKRFRLQVIIADKNTSYKNIGESDYWNSGGFWQTYLFINKHKLKDKIRRYIFRR